MPIHAGVRRYRHPTEAPANASPSLYTRQAFRVQDVAIGAAGPPHPWKGCLALSPCGVDRLSVDADVANDRYFTAKHGCSGRTVRRHAPDAAPGASRAWVAFGTPSEPQNDAARNATVPCDTRSRRKCRPIGSKPPIKAPSGNDPRCAESALEGRGLVPSPFSSPPLPGFGFPRAA